MSRRVALGKLGTDSSTGKYGLRVSRPTTDAVPAASSSATVSIDDLRFDSLTHVIGHAPIYRIYDVTVAAASVIDNGDTVLYFHTPGSYTQAFGETLTYIPIPVLFYKDGSTLKGDFWKIHNYDGDNGTHDWYVVSNKQLGADEGYEADVTKTNFTVYNWNTSQRVFRLFLLDASAVT
jgi:hypothetical protein